MFTADEKASSDVNNMFGAQTQRTPPSYTSGKARRASRSGSSHLLCFSSLSDARKEGRDGLAHVESYLQGHARIMDGCRNASISIRPRRGSAILRCQER